MAVEVAVPPTHVQPGATTCITNTGIRHVNETLG